MTIADNADRLAALPHYTRRMLQALNAYWEHCDGLAPGKYPRGRYDMEMWWIRFEGYRTQVEKILKEHEAR